MKFQIAVSDESYDNVKKFLEEHGIETSDDAVFIIREVDRYPSFLNAKNSANAQMKIGVGDVVFIESFRKEIEIHTMDETFFAIDRMYQLETILDPREFIRISKSVIISRKHVKKIRPSLSMKYVLTLSDGTVVDVTRSYYYNFKTFFNI